jgi:succinyl-diaminopimelate desuccinylase
MINNDRLMKLIKDIIAIDSQNPPGGERELARFVASFLHGYGVRTRIIEYKPRRANILAYMGRKSKAKTLLITPHLDTVPAGKSWTVDPFAGVIRGDRLFGLGATDCKCNLACALEAMASIARENVELPYSLVMAATADEESGSALGLIPLLKDRVIRPDMALVLDADDYSVVVAQKGLLHVKVRIRGKKAHGAYPWLGVNAIDLAAAVLSDVKKFPFPASSHRYLRPATVNVGTIRGGDKVNVVADWCEFELDFRFLPGSRAEDFMRPLKKIIAKHARRYTLDIQGVQQPYTIDVRHPLVAGLAHAMKSCHVRPRICGSEGATVITFFQHYGIPAVATGFGSSPCAHKADEYVDVRNLPAGARVVEAFLRGFRF